VKHVVTVYDLYSGANLYDIPLPVGSIINSLSGKRKENTMFYKVASYLSPGTIFKFDFEKQEQSVFKETDVKGLKANELETKQVFYESKDGTKVPMYIFHRKDLVLDGSNPALLYGYGGFNISITPSFSASWITFVQHMGGVVAVANIRGGSEYGNDW
jgi:prolyl oligopeptidase